MAEMIVVEQLRKQFGALVAVDGVSLSVRQGDVLGFLGPNGAGKTTTMRMIAGYLEPSGGSVQVCGFDVARQPIETKRRVGYLPEGAPLYGEMTGERFLMFAADVRGFSGEERRRRIARVVDLVSLGDVLDQPIETLSKGFKRRVGLAQALIHDPPVLILDEPTDGLDPNQKHQVRELIRAMARDKAIIISTHILEEVEAVCTRAVILADGRLVADGTAESLLAQLPEHNAILVNVPVAAAAAARAALLAVAAGAGRRVHEQPDGDSVVLRLFRDAAHPTSVADVADALRRAEVPIESLRVERGRLDDIFRRLTTERERRHAA